MTTKEKNLWKQANEICGCAIDDAPKTSRTLLEKLEWVQANAMGRGTDGAIDAAKLSALIARAAK